MGRARSYVLALAAVGLTTVAGMVVQAFAGLERIPFIIFIPAVLVAAGRGIRPGLLATAAAGLAIEAFLGGRASHLPTTGENTVGLVLFLAIGAAISGLSGKLAEARERSRTIVGDLERQALELEALRTRAEELARDATRHAQQFETLFEVAPIGIGYAGDRECRSISVNRHLAAMLRIDEAQNASLSAPPGERPPFTALTPDGQPIAAEALPMQTAARTGIPVPDVEIDVRYADGSYARLQQYAAPLFDETGAVRGAIGAFLDITERHRLTHEQHFLSDASRLLASALADVHVLAQLPRLAVPAQADWAVLDLVDPDGTRRRVGHAHRDPAKDQLLARVAEEHPIDARPGGWPGPLDLVGEGRARLVQDVRTGDYVGREGSEDHLASLEALATASAVIVPLMARDGGGRGDDLGPRPRPAALRRARPRLRRGGRATGRPWRWSGCASTARRKKPTG